MITLFTQTSALLYSYQKLTEIALKFYIIEHHNSSRIGVTSGLTSDIGDTLCLLQSLLGDSEMPESVYRIRQSVTDMDISEMVPYTCRTLSQSITGLNSIAGSMRTTLLTTLNDFAWNSYCMMLKLYVSSYLHIIQSKLGKIYYVYTRFFPFSWHATYNIINYTLWGRTMSY